MKKRLLLFLAALCVFGAAASAANAQQEHSPHGVANLLIHKLESQGKRPGALEKAEAFLLSGQRYILPFQGGGLQLFAYEDADAAARELLNVSADGGEVYGVKTQWSAPPHFYLRDNVIILYVGENAGILKMLDPLCGPQIRGEPVQL